MKKISQSEVDYRLDIKAYWSNKEKRDHINSIFRHWNNKTNLLNDKATLLKAEEMLIICATGIELYKQKPHKRKYKKITKRGKKVVEKASNSGCIIPIMISLSSFGLLIWILIL